MKLFQALFVFGTLIQVFTQPFLLLVGSYTLPNSDVYGAQFYTFGFKRKEAAQVNAIRFYFESGNIASGEIVMYGIANGS